MDSNHLSTKQQTLDTSASLDTQFISNPKHLHPEKHSWLDFPNEAFCASRNCWSSARVPMRAYVIMNSSIGVPSPNPNLPHENLAIHPSPATLWNRLSLWSRRHCSYGGVSTCYVFSKEAYQRTYLVDQSSEAHQRSFREPCGFQMKGTTEVQIAGIQWERRTLEIQVQLGPN